MNVQLSPDRASKVMRWMCGVGWRSVLLGMALAVSGIGYAIAAGTNPSATQTALTVTTDNAGPRTKITLSAHVAEASGSEAVGGVVNFRAADATGLNSDLGSAVLDGEGNAVLTTNNLAAGSARVVAAYVGNSAHLGSLSASQQVQAQDSGVAGFTVSATPTALSTPMGGFVTSVITVTPVNGFNTQMNTYVSLSCSELPFGTTCTFSPTNLQATCTPTCTTVTSTLQIQTLQASASNSIHDGAGRGSRVPVYALLFPAFLGLAGMGARKRRVWRNSFLILLVLAGAMSITACNPRYYYLNRGPIPNTGTPAGAYSITVNSVATVGSQIFTPPTSPQLALTVTQ